MYKGMYGGGCVMGDSLRYVISDFLRYVVIHCVVLALVICGYVAARGAIMDEHRKPDLRCEEHCELCDVVHSIHGRLVILEARVLMLEKELGALVDDDA